MKLTNYNYEEGHGVWHSVSEGYKQADDYYGIPGGASGLAQWAKGNIATTAFFAVGVPSMIFTAMNMKAGFITAAEASGFFAKTAGYLIGTNQALAASLPGVIGTGIAGQIVAGAIMAIAAAAVVYGLYKGIEKVSSCFTGTSATPAGEKGAVKS